MVLVGLTRVGGEELVAVDDLVDDGGHVVVVGARTEEGETLLGGAVAPERPGDLPVEVLLGQDRLGEREPAAQPQVLGHVGVELLDRLGSDGLEHLGPGLRRAVGDVRVNERVWHVVLLSEGPCGSTDEPGWAGYGLGARGDATTGRVQYAVYSVLTASTVHKPLGLSRE